jgi:hypothetical protein
MAHHMNSKVICSRKLRQFSGTCCQGPQAYSRTAASQAPHHGKLCSCRCELQQTLVCQVSRPRKDYRTVRSVYQVT